MKDILIRQVKGLLLIAIALPVLFAFFGVNAVNAHPTTTVYVDPPLVVGVPAPPDATPNQFTISIGVSDVNDLWAFGLELHFKPFFKVLQPVSCTEGPFLKGFGTTFFVCRIDQAAQGKIIVGNTLFGAPAGASGSGVLATIVFKIVEAGETPLELKETTLISSSLLQIDHTTSDGFYSGPTANLIRRSAWPEHHHYVLFPGDEDTNQTLSGKVNNLGSVALKVRVKFIMVQDTGSQITVVTSVAEVAPGAVVDLKATFGPLDTTDVGKYYVSAFAEFSYYGKSFQPGEKVKSFSFAVVS